MAGSIGNGATFWNVGDTTGRDDSGASVALPVGFEVITAGTGAPSAAPKGSPIYQDTANDNVYVWTGATWIGPYNKGT